MKKANEAEARCAVHIAAVTMRAAGLCKMREAFHCRKADFGADAKFNACVDCIEQWLYRKAKDRVRETPPKPEASVWISANLELPPNNDVVLAVVNGWDCSGRQKIHFRDAIELAIYDAGEIEWILDSYPNAEVTASYWMPLPDAPGGDKDE